MFASFNDHRDTERLTQWMRDYGRAVRGYMFALVRHAEIADDLTQDVFRKAWQARCSYQEHGTPLAYLLRIADRTVCDWARQIQPELNLEDEGWHKHEPTANDEDVMELAYHAEACEQLAAALDQLAPIQRRVLLLRYYGNLSFSQIAATLDCPLNTALSHCHRALTTLRKRLAGKV